MSVTVLEWGYKLVGVDLTTDDHQGGRFRYRLGQWHEANPGGRKFTTTGDCPAFPGDGLCVARTLRGAQSGGARLGASTMLLVGYEPADVLCDSGDKVRVKRLFVAPDPVDPVRAVIGPGANLTGAYLAGANLAGADLAGANLAGANLARAYLTKADLTRADLTRAYLAGADLTRANLTRANLTGANLGWADLAGANLTRAYRPSWLPGKWAVTAHGYITEVS